MSRDQEDLSREIAQCYQQASFCRARIQRATDPQQRQLLLDTERRWLLLAKSHEMRQRLTAYTEQAKERVHVLTPLHPAIPRVMCPQCGKNMRLERVEPVSTPRADKVTYRCECSMELQQTIERVD
jgi:lysyl-tRNA synthetase class I